MFDIRINYKTGNSFGSHIEIDMLDLPTNSIDIAKENLKRIKEHYKVYEKKSSCLRQYKEIIYPDFYITEIEEQNHKWECDGIVLLTDKGEHRLYSPFWIGYFETLNSCEIIYLDNEED
jgi:hypothetical protein